MERIEEMDNVKVGEEYIQEQKANRDKLKHFINGAGFNLSKSVLASEVIPESKSNRRLAEWVKSLVKNQSEMMKKVSTVNIEQ